MKKRGKWRKFAGFLAEATDKSPQPWSPVILGLSQSPFNCLPHCVINLTTWHCVLNPHHLAQPTSPILPPTATLHPLYLAITTVFQSAGSCSHPQIPSLLFLSVQIPGILHQPWRRPPVLKDSWLSQQEGKECQPLYFYFSHHIAPPQFVWGTRIHISSHWLNFKLKNKQANKQNKTKRPHIYPYIW